MTNVVAAVAADADRSTGRAEALALRLEQGARALAEFASTLTDEEWKTKIPGDLRPVGVVVHHVASIYPIEIQFAQVLAAGKPVTGLTWADVHALNAQHAQDNANATKADTLAVLRRNSAAAAEAIRKLTDRELALAAPVSMYADAPLTCQFFLEDHAVRHSYHHLAAIRRIVTR